MPSERTSAPTADPFIGLRDRLTRAADLAIAMRESLLIGDAPAIDAATARLGTIATETKLLVEELRRVEVDELRRTQVDWDGSLVQLARVTTRLARESAVAGGLLDGLVTLSQRLLDTFAVTGGDSYDAAGHSQRPKLQGMQLKETI